MGCFHDEEKAKTLELTAEQMITPVTNCRNRIKFQCYEFAQLKEAQDITLADHTKIAQTIK